MPEDPNIYKGDVAAKEQPGSGATELGGQITLKFKGMANGLAAIVTSAIPATHTVVSRRTTPGKGGLAECVVVLKPKASVPGSGGSGTETLSCTFEIEMAQLEKPLLAHPDFSGYADHIDAWRQSPPEIRNANEYVTGTDANGEYTTASLTSAELDVAAKIRKGVESYLAFVPVVTKTTVSENMPSVGANIGKRGAPRLTPSGTWEWLKTGDKAVQRQDGAWERVEQWTAADEWDHDLYGAAI